MVELELGRGEPEAEARRLDLGAGHRGLEVGDRLVGLEPLGRLLEVGLGVRDEGGELGSDRVGSVLGQRKFLRAERQPRQGTGSGTPSALVPGRDPRRRVVSCCLRTPGR